MQADTVGGITPAVLVSLAPKEKVLAAHEIMLYKEPQVTLHRRTMKSLGVGMGHLLALRGAGDNEEGYFFAEFEGPGHVTFSRDKGGEVRIRPLAPGQTLRLKSGHLICFEESVKYNPMVLFQYQDPVPDANGQHRTVSVFGDELTGPGQIVFQSYGNILSFTLQPGEALRTNVDSLLAADHTVQLRVNWLGGGSGMAVGGNVALPVIDVMGPGVVLVHSGL